MSYLNNIPTAAQRLRDSQPQLLENFATNSALIGVDHIINPWTDPATGNQGKHNQVTLPEQADDPGTLADEMMIYTKAVAGVSQMFIQRENVAATTDGIDFTSAVAATTGDTILPSGIHLKWGNAATDGNGDATIAFTNAFPNTTFIIQATVTIFDGTSASGDQDSYVRIYTYTLAQFEVVGFRLNTQRTRRIVPFHWFAMGN